MLDRSKVLKALQDISNNLFTDYSDEVSLAHEVWRHICRDPEFAIKIASANCSDLLLPTWQGKLSDVYDIHPTLSNYSVSAVDGSQIYPDKHQGTTCYLLNIGIVHLSYGKNNAQPVQLISTPYVFTGQDEDDFDNSQEMINCRRQALELQAGMDVCITNLLLFDGSLIFWHLDSKDKNVQQYFLPKYFYALEQLSEQQTLFASYISLPKSKELVNLVRFYLRDPSIHLATLGTQDERGLFKGFNQIGQGCKCSLKKENKNCVHPECPAKLEERRRVYQRIEHKNPELSVDHLVDTTLASFFLQPNQRTTVFYNHSTITQHYPEQLKPCFFYMHIGDEIARVEIPFWIAADKALTDTVARIALNQAHKGHGYPVCLAEAHEQAVVKGPDRDFFYHIVQKLGIEQKKKILLSLKSMKKRRIGI